MEKCSALWLVGGRQHQGTNELRRGLAKAPPAWFGRGWLLLGLVLVTGAIAGDRSGRLPAVTALPQNVRGEAAVAALGNQLPAVAQAYGQTAAGLRARFLVDQDLWVDTAGRLFYRCAGLRAPAGAQPAPRTAADGPVRAPVSIDNPPIYHSKPGAPNVIFLDVNGGWYGTGYAGSAWGGPFNTYAFDTDGDTTTFSDGEQVAIKRVWQRVAEDYAPFNVDVTTDPATSGTKSVILFTQDTCANGVSTPAAGYGGIAYVGVFGSSTYWPAWVSTNGVSFAEDNMAEAGSHEMGHNLSL